MTIRVLLADDHRLFREGLRALLAKKSEVAVVGEAGDGVEAVAKARTLQAHLVVMDIEMPLLNGIEASRRIYAELPGVQVIILSTYADRRHVTEALRTGATGYLLKESAFEDVGHAISAVVAGQVYLSAGITGIVVEDWVHRAPEAADSAYGQLTARERQILQLLAEGKNTKETAQLLDISIKTVESHRTHIMDKLDLHSVAELTRYAVREGLTKA